jgi:alpha-L-arabinofuranosidase
MLIEPNRWYDVQLEARGTEVRCSVDGKLLASGVQMSGAPLEPLYVSATRDLKTQEVILKVVNVGDELLPTQVSLAGLVRIGAKARVITLSGLDRPAQNSVEEPEKIKPVETESALTGPEFTYSFPPRSITVLRVPGK